MPSGQLTPYRSDRPSEEHCGYLQVTLVEGVKQSGLTQLNVTRRTIRTLARSETAVTNTRPVTSILGTAHRYFILFIECGQADSRKLFI